MWLKDRQGRFRRDRQERGERWFRLETMAAVSLAGMVLAATPGKADARDTVGDEEGVPGPLTLSSVQGGEEGTIDYGPTPMDSIPKGKTRIFLIPPPRGMIVTSDGVAVATTRTRQRLVVRPLALGEDATEALASLESIAEFLPEVSNWQPPRDSEVKEHFRHRPWLLPVR